QASEALMSKFYLPNLNLEYHLCRWAKKIDGSTVALAIFCILNTTCYAGGSKELLAVSRK
ncbi:MAG: hypothetical protein KIC66_05910, partial [Clostridium sp.]|uniref:hypothetical protein n=1 Tax=Clostridium sp. TaxID=1506 RepID=UPI0025BE45CB